MHKQTNEKQQNVHSLQTLVACQPGSQPIAQTLLPLPRALPGVEGEVAPSLVDRLRPVGAVEAAEAHHHLLLLLLLLLLVVHGSAPAELAGWAADFAAKAPEEQAEEAAEAAGWTHAVVAVVPQAPTELRLLPLGWVAAPCLVACCQELAAGLRLAGRLLQRSEAAEWQEWEARPGLATQWTCCWQSFCA
jgi:hypothetical protein